MTCYNIVNIAKIFFNVRSFLIAKSLFLNTAKLFYVTLHDTTLTRSKSFVNSKEIFYITGFSIAKTFFNSEGFFISEEFVF